MVYVRANGVSDSSVEKTAAMVTSSKMSLIKQIYASLAS